ASDTYISTALTSLTYSFFFFQAEDGIRDRNVTGVQTCALPILLARTGVALNDVDIIELNEAFSAQSLAVLRELGLPDDAAHVNRSEERRVGKECRSRWVR